MSLAIALVVFCLVLEVLLDILFVSKERAQKRRQQLLLQEAASYAAQAKRISDPSNFAVSAKLQRKAVALEAESASLQAKQDAISNAKLKTALQRLKLAGCVIAVLILWRKPAVQIDPAFMWPIQGWMHVPHGKQFAGTGAIMVLPWISLTRKACSTIVISARRFVDRFATNPLSKQ